MEWWEFVLVLVIVMPIVVLWIGCLIDAIARPDLSGINKVLWTLAILFFPLIGSLVYILVRPKVVMVANPGLIDETWQGSPTGMFDVGTRVNYEGAPPPPNEYPQRQ